LENTPVIISSMDRATRNLPELVSMAGFNVKKCRLALIKPNVCGLYIPSLKLLSATISFLDAYADEILVGETGSMIHSPEQQFQKLGITQLAAQFSKHVRTIDLSDDAVVKAKVPNPHVLQELRLPASLAKSDVLVNLPKVGTHMTTTITCALKNLFGLMPERRKHSTYHTLGIDNVIADIAQVVKPSLNIVDAEEKVIIGLDPLSVDIVACKFLDVDPSTITHLKLVSKDRGENLQAFKKKIQTIEL
jgi:uncharacterized protein (DUF362 family)